MTAKEYLKQLRYIDTIIDSKLDTVYKLDALAKKCTSSFSDEPRSTNGVTREDIIIKKIMLEQEINQSIDELIDLKQEIIRKIESMDRDIYQVILLEIYVVGRKMEEIAVSLHYDYRSIKRLHGAALQEFSKIM